LIGQNIMYRYDGVVVHESYDNEGIIEVVEADGIRALHFGSSSRQSSIIIDDPNQLHTLYARATMGLLLFNDSPKDVLMIGLGGGTLTKYLLYEFTDCRVKVVEFRESVLKIARSHFNLPFDPRLKVGIGCGGHYVHQRSLEHEEEHDLIVIDAYSDEGMSPEVSSQSFFYHCKMLLKKDGLLAINLWITKEDLFHEVMCNMAAVFESKILFLPVRKRGNVIGFAFREDTPDYSMKELRKKAKLLEEQYHLEFPVFLKDIKRSNPRFLHHVIPS
jgi:spermidine synthase